MNDIDQQKLQILVDKAVELNTDTFVWNEKILKAWPNIDNKGCRLSQYISVDVKIIKPPKNNKEF